MRTGKPPRRMLRKGGRRTRPPEFRHLPGIRGIILPFTPSSWRCCWRRWRWGMLDSLRLLNRGTLPLRVGTDPITKPDLNTEERAMLERMMSKPDHVFINHTKDFEFFQGVNDKLIKYAAEAGYRREIQAVIA